MKKEELLKKYCASEIEIEFLSDYLESFATTFRERYDKADLEALHSAFAPVFLDKLEHVKRKNGIGSEITTQIEDIENKFINKKEIININFKKIFEPHFSIKLGTKNDNFHTKFTILKVNKSIFLVEHTASISIKILQHFYSEKEEQFEQQKNFMELLKNLINDFS